LGIVLDCCTKPSHDLGRNAHFHSMFGEMRAFLINNGIKKVFVACPNCYQIFKHYGGDITVQTVYEFISGNGLPIKTDINNTATIHDPCSLRFEEPIQSAIRNIVTRQGIAINEMVHSGNKTLCCGEGGSVGFISPEVSNKWSDIRKAEANGNRTVTYCGGCTDQLGKKIPTTHILDLLFEPQAALSGKVKVSKTPMTYFNRLRIKNFFKKATNSAVSRERTFSPNEDSRKGRALVHAFFVLLIIAAIISVHLTGAEQYLEQEGLRQLDQEYGTLAGTTTFAETQKHPEIKIIKGAANNHMRVDTASRELRISATVTKDVTKPSVANWGRRCQAFFGVKGGKMEEFFVFTTDVSRTDINNAILELGIKSRRQIPFEEIAARQGLKHTTTEDDYLNGDPVIVTICFEKNGEIVESAMEDMIREKILVEDREVIKPYTPHFIYHGTGEALNFPSGCIVCPSDCNGGIITDNALPLKTAISYYKVNWDRMPPVGSKVEVSIKSIYGSSRLLSTKP
ncbi:MAG: (Fe-S)-binding protein, partial [Deltaproteobacteria bacterium]|nr:(Fe-S)-binding protein [Deltaproteobacteria bacterium]